MFKSLITVILFIITQVSQANIIMPTPPELNSKANILIDYDTGKVLQSNQADTKLPIASVTKVMTAFVIFSELKKGTISLKDEVSISKKAWQKTGSKMFIEVGKIVVLEDLLKGLLVQSGNDAAIALAEHVAGSEKEFAGLMNQYAKSIGMESSNFKNPTGLHHKKHYSTATDLALLGRLVIKEFPDMYKYFSIPEFQYNNIRQKNRNKLIHENTNKYDGFKTGYTSQAKYCLMASATHSERRVIMVVIGAEKSKYRFEDARIMANYGLKFFENYSLNIKDSKDFLIDIPTYYTKEDFLQVTLKESFVETLPRGSKKKLTFLANIPDVIDRPLARGEIIGNVEILLNNEKLKNIDIVSTHKLTPAGGLKYWSDYIILNWLN
jgi:D-alanyl-D-alanine carboxypeptidase (penicillin-binding protein 5/6)